jgi:hypothetical protein
MMRKIKKRENSMNNCDLQQQQRQQMIFQLKSLFVMRKLRTIKLPMTVSSDKIMNMVAMMIFCVKLYGDIGGS